MTPWWVVVTAEYRERRAALALTDLGFEVWYPVRLVRFRKAKFMRTAVEREYPQFPSYLFVRSVPDFAEAWHRLHGADGVKALLCRDGLPLTLPQSELDRVRRQLDGIRDVAIDAQIWRVNDAARISAGPFEGLEGVVSRSERRGSVAVLLSLFGRMTAVEVGLEQLERAA